MRLESYKITSYKEWVDIGCTDGTSLYSRDVGEVLQYLMEASKVLNTCWDLDAEITPLLKLLGEEKCKKLAETNKCFSRPFTVFYIPSKLLSISPVYSKEQFNLYQLKQYFPDEKEPGELTGIKAKGNQVLEVLAGMGIYPEKLTSPVAMYEQSVMRHLDLPSMKSIPKEAGYYAWQCSGKLWIEAFMLGYWEQAWDYDIVASFPSIVRGLYDLRYCYWKNSKELPLDAVYGYCKCRVNIWAKVSPIIYVDGKGKSTTPVGSWETYLTLSEIQFINEWKIGKVEIIDGWWAFKKEPIVESYPFQVVMDRLLRHKDSEDKLIAHLAKQMAVGVYGKFGEEHKDKFGKYFNPVYFAEVSTRIRLEVAKFIYKHELQENLIHVSVDGVLVDQEVEL